MQQPRIWLVEDEQSIADTLVYMLQQEGFQVTVFDRGLPALEAAAHQAPDAAILDVGLPDISGFELCRRLLTRYPALPVLFLTARSDEVDKLLGLEIGADDYIAKPYSPREVVARVKTILRRCKPQRELQLLDAESPLIVDESRFQASWRSKLLDLTPAEFRLLKTLSHEPGKVFSREQLLNHLYDDYRVVTDRTIDSHIKNLRRKL